MLQEEVGQKESLEEEIYLEQEEEVDNEFQEELKFQEEIKELENQQLQEEDEDDQNAKIEIKENNQMIQENKEDMEADNHLKVDNRGDDIKEQQQQMEEEENQTEKKEMKMDLESNQNQSQNLINNMEEEENEDIQQKNEKILDNGSLVQKNQNELLNQESINQNIHIQDSQKSLEQNKDQNIIEEQFDTKVNENETKNQTSEEQEQKEQIENKKNIEFPENQKIQIEDNIELIENQKIKNEENIELEQKEKIEINEHMDQSQNQQIKNSEDFKLTKNSEDFKLTKNQNTENNLQLNEQQNQKLKLDKQDINKEKINEADLNETEANVIIPQNILNNPEQNIQNDQQQNLIQSPKNKTEQNQQDFKAEDYSQQINDQKIISNEFQKEIKTPDKKKSEDLETKTLDQLQQNIQKETIEESEQNQIQQNIVKPNIQEINDKNQEIKKNIIENKIKNQQKIQETINNEPKSIFAEQYKKIQELKLNEKGNDEDIDKIYEDQIYKKYLNFKQDINANPNIKQADFIKLREIYFIDKYQNIFLDNLYFKENQEQENLIDECLPQIIEDLTIKHKKIIQIDQVYRKPKASKVFLCKQEEFCCEDLQMIYLQNAIQKGVEDQITNSKEMLKFFYILSNFNSDQFIDITKDILDQCILGEFEKVKEIYNNLVINKEKLMREFIEYQQLIIKDTLNFYCAVCSNEQQNFLRMGYTLFSQYTFRIKEKEKINYFKKQAQFYKFLNIQKFGKILKCIYEQSQVPVNIQKIENLEELRKKIENDESFISQDETLNQIFQDSYLPASFKIIDFETINFYFKNSVTYFQSHYSERLNVNRIWLPFVVYNNVNDFNIQNIDLVISSTGYDSSEDFANEYLVQYFNKILFQVYEKNQKKIQMTFFKNEEDTWLMKIQNEFQNIVKKTLDLFN